MKRLMVLVILCLFMLLPIALADAPMPTLPEGDFSVQDVSLTLGKKWPVFTGPGEEYRQANAGKASVGTNGWVQVLGGDQWSYLLVQYAVSDTRLRIGWISVDALPEKERNFATVCALGERFRWRESHLSRYAELTDDPLLSQEPVIRLQAGETVQYLARMGDWAYVEAAGVCGFVPWDAVVFDPVNVDAHPSFRDAADLLALAGIQAEPTGIHRQTIYFDLKNGGRFWAYYYGSEYNPILTPLQFNCTIEHATDEDVGKYLDAVFTLVSEVDHGVIDHAVNWYDVESAREAIVSTALLYQEYLGEQGLRVLLAQLARHDGQDEINSLRARLASRLLGVKDKSGVDPALGCQWYDALRLAVQDALPPVDAAVYESDPILQAADQALMERYAAEDDGYDSPSYEQKKGAFIVSLKECERAEEGNWVAIWAAMGEEQIAVYDGADFRLVSGSWYPVHLVMERGANGEWQLTDLFEPEDGELYWPSILSMCDGDEALADTLCQADCGIGEAIRKYLVSAGFPAAAEAVK